MLDCGQGRGLRSSFDWAPARRLVLGAVVLTALSALLLPGRSQAAATEVTVTLSPSSIVANGTSTSTVTATVTTGTTAVLGQTVVFSSGDAKIHFSATVANANGTYTATVTSSTVARTAKITATDTTPAQPVAGQATLTLTPSPATKIGLSLAPGTINADGLSYTTATATVSDAFGNPVPADSVVFSSSDPGETVLQVTSDGNGTYSALIRSSTTPGEDIITATDTAVNLSANALLLQTASLSALSIVPFPTSSVTNERVTLFAVVSPTAGSSGTITFTDGAAPIAGCVAEPVAPSSPAAPCQTSFAASTSPEHLTAAFTPDAGSNLSSSIAQATVIVGPDSTSTSLDASPTVITGTRTTYTATVKPPANRPGPIQPSGSVQFFDGGRAISSCTNQPLINGGATCTVAYGARGRHSITASYGGDANFTGSTSSSGAVDVVALPPQVLGIITSTMQWSFYYTSQYTRVLSLMVNGVPADATVHVTCRGRGCPFAKRVAAIAKTRRCGLKGKPRCATNGKINLASGLRKHPLHVGTRLAVQITRPGWIGKSYVFAMRRSRGPRVQIACLAPRGTRPGVGC
jgi:Bacterial Ig-like domain (group 3)/Invasin, domain 3